MIEHVLAHLAALVGFDTSDPRRTLSPDHPAIAYVVRVLGSAGCRVSVQDLGDGCVNVLALRGGTGNGGLLLNCHLDTVARDPAWTRDPFTLSFDGPRAHGLGACDIKGGAACMLAAVESTDAPVAVLFTTDEEGGKGWCVGHFVDTMPLRPGLVVVAEPTRARPVLQHRGFASFEIDFRGLAGHTSELDAASASALHRAVRWSAAALELAETGPLRDARFNIGLIEGGRASNVVASHAKLRGGFRPMPGPDSAGTTSAAMAALRASLPADGSATWSDRFIAPSLTASPLAEAAVGLWGLERGPDVDFWTEAALFADAGLPSVVLGPGHISQAHAADEYVEITELASCLEAYRHIIRTGVPAPQSGSASVHNPAPLNGGIASAP